MYSLVHCPDPPDLSVWVHAAPKLVASRGCEPHFAAARGGVRRRSPTGGAANGTPRNAVTPLSVVPVEHALRDGRVRVGWVPARRPRRIEATTGMRATNRRRTLASQNLPRASYGRGGR